MIHRVISPRNNSIAKYMTHNYLSSVDLTSDLFCSHQKHTWLVDLVTFFLQTYPQCFIFCGLSILTAIFIFNSSGQFFLLTFILYHSGCLLYVEVGWMITLPSSLSSKLNIPELSVKSLTFTTGSGCVVVKSPCVSQLKLNNYR